MDWNKKSIIRLLRHTPTLIPDESLWDGIKQNILEDQHQALAKALAPTFWDKCRSWGSMPRPAFTLATMIILMVMIGSSGQLFMNSSLVRVSGSDQMEYISSLINDPVSDNNGSDTQTPIEKYFL